MDNGCWINEVWTFEILGRQMAIAVAETGLSAVFEKVLFHGEDPGPEKRKKKEGNGIHEVEYK